MRMTVWSLAVRRTTLGRLLGLAAILLLAVGIAWLLRSPSQQALWPLEVRAARRHGLPPALVAAVVEAESGGNRYAVSARGALGLMQATRDKFEPTQNPFDAETNLDVGAQYLAEQLKAFNGNLTLALAAYNAGPAAVHRYHGVPPYPETKAYIRRVLRIYHHWRQRPG